MVDLSDHNGDKGAKMGKYEREKGARAERLLAKALSDHGVNASRGFFVSGQADVIGVDGIHAEVKAVERLNVWAAMNQAEADAKKMQGGFPTVFHKRNYTGFLVTMKLADWIEMYKVWRNVCG